MWFSLVILLLSLLPLYRTNSLSTVHFDVSPCPTVIGCRCDQLDKTRISCTSIDSSTVQQLSIHYPQLEQIRINKWKDDTLDVDFFSNFSSLQRLEVTGSKITRLESSGESSAIPITHVSLDANRIYNWTEICKLTKDLKSIRHLSLSSNRLKDITGCDEWGKSLESLDISHNEISSLSSLPPVSSLDLSYSSIPSLNSSLLPRSLSRLSLSSSPLSSLSSPFSHPTLVHLNLSETSFSTLPQFNLPRLQELLLDSTKLHYADLSSLSRSPLQSLSLRDSPLLSSLYGSLPPTVSRLSLTHSQLATLPIDFFKRAKPSSIDLRNNTVLSCDACFLQWTSPLKDELASQINCSLKNTQCTQPKVLVQDMTRARMGKEAFMRCDSSVAKTMEWWLYRPATYLGSFDPARGKAHTANESGPYRIMPGGVLHIVEARRDLIERYVCVVRPTKDGVINGTAHFRLDYSFWYSFDVFESVFYGCLMTATLACAASFILNITWILSRKSILWWIQRAERMSRVSKMVEAVEKYRQKQMETIHDNYNKKVQAVRDSYHQQVEQLRQGYSGQVERFRDYKAARMENVQSHLDSLRDNYQQQMQRVREYGSRRAETLWESYERQMNRVRMFNLQSRLKLMRQYNLKQRYINKLFETFQKENADPESIRKHEEEVRAVLDLPDTSAPLPVISRSSSFYSLPEYVLGEDGTLRPSPLAPSSSPPFPRRGPSIEVRKKKDKDDNDGDSKETSSTPPPGPSSA